MKSVGFTFHEEASEENQNRVRERILALPGVHSVGRISPSATKPALRRMWYAEVADESVARELVRQLRQDGIEAAEPAERGSA